MPTTPAKVPHPVYAPRDSSRLFDDFLLLESFFKVGGTGSEAIKLFLNEAGMTVVEFEFQYGEQYLRATALPSDCGTKELIRVFTPAYATIH